MASYDTADSATADNDARSFDGQSPSKLSQTLFGSVSEFPSSSPAAAADAHGEINPATSPATAIATATTTTATFSSLLAAVGVETMLKMEDAAVNVGNVGTSSSPLSDSTPRPIEVLSLTELDTSSRLQPRFYTTQAVHQPSGPSMLQSVPRFYEQDDMFSMPQLPSMGGFEHLQADYTSPTTSATPATAAMHAHHTGGGQQAVPYNFLYQDPSMMPSDSSASAGYGMPGLTGEMPLRSIEADDGNVEGGERSRLYNIVKGEEEEEEEEEDEESTTPHTCKIEEEEEPAGIIIHQQAMNMGLGTSIYMDTKPILNMDKRMSTNMSMNMSMNRNANRNMNTGMDLDFDNRPPVDLNDWRARLRFCERAPNKSALDASMVRLLEFPEGITEEEMEARRDANLRFDRIREQRLKDRNNEAAKRSRQRKVQRIEAAERRITTLSAERDSLLEQVAALQQQVAGLQERLREYQDGRQPASMPSAQQMYQQQPRRSRRRAMTGQEDGGVDDEDDGDDGEMDGTYDMEDEVARANRLHNRIWA